MRIAIFGTGGVGAYFGAQLVRAGEDVTFVARGEHLQAIRERGLRIETDDGNILISVAQATDNPAEVGPVDGVLLGVKSWQVTESAHAMKPLIGAETFVVPLQNGVEAPGQLTAVLGAQHVLGGLCGTFSWVVGPGHIRSLGVNHFIKFGELDNRPSERSMNLRDAFERAGVRVEIPPDIQAALWEKLLLVAGHGGVGAVARAPVGVVRSVPQTRNLIVECMQEIFAVARAHRVALAEGTVEKMMAFVDAVVPGATTSLHRDIAAGKPSELEAWNGAVVRLGSEVGVPTPLHEFIYHSLLPGELRARGEIEYPA